MRLKRTGRNQTVTVGPHKSVCVWNHRCCYQFHPSYLTLWWAFWHIGRAAGIRQRSLWNLLTGASLKKQTFIMHRWLISWNPSAQPPSLSVTYTWLSSASAFSKIEKPPDEISSWAWISRLGGEGEQSGQVTVNKSSPSLIYISCQQQALTVLTVSIGWFWSVWLGATPPTPTHHHPKSSPLLIRFPTF